MIKHQSFTVKETELRLDKFLTSKLPEFSRSKIQNLIKLGQVTINGKPAKPSLILHGEESIECHFKPIIKDKTISGEAMDLKILYEDDSLAVINKPSGLVVHPGSGNWSGTLLNGLIHHFNDLSRQNSQRPGIVHRLDKETSGIIVIAKNDVAHDYMCDQFNKRNIKKQYVALAWGKIENKGIIKGDLGRDNRNRKLFAMVKNGGRYSSTKYKLENYFPPLSWVKLYPETGRTHQLRVHLKSIGHPIFCDDAYGGGVNYVRSFHVKYTQLLNRLLKKVDRVALHAHTLEFYHPLTNEIMKFEAPIPDDLNSALEILNNENK